MFERERLVMNLQCLKFIRIRVWSSKVEHFWNEINSQLAEDVYYWDKNYFFRMILKSFDLSLLIVIVFFSAEFCARQSASHWFLLENFSI